MNRAETDLQAQMVEKSRKRKKEKTVITLSSDSETERKKRNGPRKVSVRQRRDSTPPKDHPKVVFNPLTKSYESNIPSVTRINTQETTDNADKQHVPSSDQLVNELLDEVF